MNILAPALSGSAQFWRTIFNATPIPVFIVDADLRILDTNQSAARMLDGHCEFVLRQRTGEVLHCVHSSASPGGCGRGAACRHCVIRNCVGLASSGQPITRQRSRMELVGGNVAKVLDILVTTAPTSFDGKDLVLLMLEDVTELLALRELIPICARCKSVRDDQAFWQGIEEYMRKHHQMDFTHGMCPKCMEEMYPDLYRLLPSVRAASAAVAPARAV